MSMRRSKPLQQPLEVAPDARTQPPGLRLEAGQLHRRNVVLGGLLGQLLDAALHLEMLLHQPPETV